MFSAILAMVLPTLAHVVQTLQCPESCDCSIIEDGGLHTSVTCDNQMLKSFPILSSSLNDRIVISLSVKDNSFSNITLVQDYFQNMNIQILDISNNRFSNIQTDVFSAMNQSLRVLAMNNIGANMDDLKVLSGLSDLENVSFRSNIHRVTDLPSGYFTGTRIKVLDLSENNFGRIEQAAFSNIKNSLQVLILNNVDVTFTDIGFLKGLSKLQKLSLDGSEDSQLSHRIFKDLGLNSLSSISIRNGEILLIRSNAFEGLENLEELDLSNNKLKQVPSDALMLLEKLKTLNLSHNSDIESIINGAFDGLVNLKTLDLRGTGINLIQDGGLAPSLKTLILRNCSLPEDSYFLVEAFKKLIDLEVLDISYNSKLCRIYNSTFDYLSQLRVLDLSGNIKIKFTDTVVKGIEDNLQVLKLNDMGLHSLPADVLSALTSLERLELAGNYLVDLSNNFLGLTEISKISEIDLRNNNITLIDKAAFRLFKANLSLELDGNNLGSLEFAAMLSPCFFKELSVTRNPIVCYCGIKRGINAVCGDLRGTCSLGNQTSLDLNSDLDLDCKAASRASCINVCFKTSCLSFFSLYVVYLFNIFKL